MELQPTLSGLTTPSRPHPNPALRTLAGWVTNIAGERGDHEIPELACTDAGTGTIAGASKKVRTPGLTATAACWSVPGGGYAV
jgi:hypothetical protein